ncbi:MAG: hypothetical protein QW478_15380, partial [Candidatus Micrarchaeaceae archaeon]
MYDLYGSGCCGSHCSRYIIKWLYAAHGFVTDWCTIVIDKYLYLFYLIYLDDVMTNMTLAIPKELMAVMKEHKEIKWSE